MAWHKESLRHAKARMGIKTGHRSQQESNATLIASLKRREPYKDFDGDGKVNKFDCNPINSKKKDYGLTDAQQKVVETELESPITKNFDEQRGNIVELENGEEWLIFDNEDDAERACQDYVKEQLEDDPESFNQEWLNEFIYVSDTDRRIIANENADNRLSDMEEDEIIEGTDYEEEFNQLNDEVLLDETTEERSKEIEKRQRELVKKAREKKQEEIYDEWYEGLKDPVGFLVDEQGLYSKEDLLKQSFISIDTKQASINVVNTDGIGHFFASYDGEQKDFSDGQVGYRTN